MTEPIRPEQVAAAKQERLPQIVIEVFNDLITRHWTGSVAIIRQEDVVERLTAAGIDRGRIFAEHMLNVEPLYRTQGWQVTYDRPGYNECYSPTFIFRIQSA